jgi:hypothetical protein
MLRPLYLLAYLTKCRSSGQNPQPSKFKNAKGYLYPNASPRPSSLILSHLLLLESLEARVLQVLHGRWKRITQFWNIMSKSSQYSGINHHSLHKQYSTTSFARSRKSKNLRSSHRFYLLDQSRTCCPRTYLSHNYELSIRGKETGIRFHFWE